MQLSADDYYIRLSELAANTPDLDGSGPVSSEVVDWLARVLALVEAGRGGADMIQLKTAVTHLQGPLRESNVHTIRSLVAFALARAELAASPDVQGQFIPVGGTHQAFAAVGKILRTARSEVLIVDAYADATALSDFAIQANEKIHIRLLTDMKKRKPDLEPAIARWRSQYGEARPLSVVFAQPFALHDRLLIIDHIDVWAIGQSFNGLGKSSPSSIIKTPSQLASDKVAAYSALWDAGEQA